MAYQYLQVVDVAKNHGLKIRETSGCEYRTNCPFCNDKKGHLYINPEKNVFHCMRCGAEGGAVKLKALLDGVPVQEVIRQCAKDCIQPSFRHPAENLSSSQLELMGFISRPNWLEWKKRDREYAKRTLNYIWRCWKAFEEQEMKNAVRWMLIYTYAGMMDEGMSIVGEREKESGINGLLETAVEIISSENPPRWFYYEEKAAREIAGAMCDQKQYYGGSKYACGC